MSLYLPSTQAANGKSARGDIAVGSLIAASEDALQWSSAKEKIMNVRDWWRDAAAAARKRRGT